MRLVFGTVLLSLVLATPVGARILFRDDFDTPVLDATRWTVPAGDASFFGRTQIRPPAAMPPPADGILPLHVDTYNPTALTPGDSFWGSEIDTIDRYPVGRGLIFEARARLTATPPAGLVGAIFAYHVDAPAGTRDELDFELLSTDLVAGRSRVLTNAFDDDDFSRPGDKSFAALPDGGLDDFHVYQIRWLPSRVEWRIDGVLVRTETGTVPDTPMSMRLNLWAPDAGFAEAFDASLQPASTPENNQRYTYEVDWVEIRTIEATSVLAFDGAQQLVNKDVGGERWAIARRLTDGTVTGNVFLPEGGAARFVWCRDVSPLPSATIVLECWGADACVAAPCGSGQWTFLAEIVLDPAFFAPSTDVAWMPIAAPVTLPRTFFEGNVPPADGGVQPCRDATCTLVSKDVEGERWAIGRDLTTLTVTGNVFVPTGAAPSFLWCEHSETTDATVTMACSIAVDD